MSKANQTFKQNDEAVSPVIGVILMVAITVVLAAVVFVLVSNLGEGQDAAESASASATSPSSGVLEITLVRAGDNAPYDNTDQGDGNDFSLSINGQLCTLNDGTIPTEAGITAPDSLNAGGVIRIDEAGLGTGCVDAFADGQDDVSVVFTVAGTAILSTTVDIDA